jgi:hypothetical protein
MVPDHLADGLRSPCRWSPIILQMVRDHLADGLRSSCRWSAIILQMVPGHLADGPRPSCRWSPTILQMVPGHLADGPRPSCRWSPTILQMVPDHLADGRRSPCRWSRIILQMGRRDQTGPAQTCGRARETVRIQEPANIRVEIRNHRLSPTRLGRAGVSADDPCPNQRRRRGRRARCPATAGRDARSPRRLHQTLESGHLARSRRASRPTTLVRTNVTVVVAGQDARRLRAGMPALRGDFTRLSGRSSASAT